MSREGQVLHHCVHWNYSSDSFVLKAFQYINICMDDDKEWGILWLQFKPDAYGHKVVLRAEFATICCFIWVNILFADVVLNYR